MTALKLEKKKRKKKQERKKAIRSNSSFQNKKENSQFLFSLKVDKNCKNSFEKFSKKLSTLVS